LVGISIEPAAAHGMGRSDIYQDASRGNGVFRTLLFLLAILIFGLLAVLPLPWQQQAILGGIIIVLALTLNVLSPSPLVTLALMATSVFSTARYGYWRVDQTWAGLSGSGHLRQWDTIFVLALVLAELYAFITLFLGYFQTLRPLRRPPLALPQDSRQWPTVDVYIPTYNESLSVVRATVIAALAMDYPSSKLKVFVLDDGRREEFHDFAARVGAGYITRDDNRHAKAGNINHALQLTQGDLIAIFDSDHVPTRSFLEATLGWFFCNRRLAMVQTPHHFYSPDPFERNLGQFRRIPNEGELFHRYIQDGNDLWNASFFCGSCAVMRRSALNQIGGIAVETVTEDAHTALRLQRKGWETAYINIPQAAGLATESLAAHIGQRVRWARGMIQILRTENPLLVRGLTFPQRLCYFNATTHFLFALPRLIFLTVPLVYLVFGMTNIYGYSLAVVSYSVPHIILSTLTNSRIQGRHRFSFWNEIYEVVLAPYILLPTLLALVNPRLGKFNVTSKGGIIRRSFFDRRIALPYILLLGLNLFGLYKGLQHYIADPAHHDTVIMNSVWTLYNVVILSVAASVAWEKRQRRSQVRVDLRVPFTLTAADGCRVRGETSQLSLRGAAGTLAVPVRLARGGRATLTLHGPDADRDIPAVVVQSTRRGQHFLFPSLTSSQEQYLVNLVHSRPEAWVYWHRSRSTDHVLLSFLRILGLSMRGLLIVVIGFFVSPPAPKRGRSGSRRKREREAAIATSMVLAALLTMPKCYAEPAAGVAHDGNPVAAAPFHEEYELGGGGTRQGFALEGPGASQNFFFGVPVTKVISAATLKLHYAAPLLRDGEAKLNLDLNGTSIGTFALSPGSDQNQEIVLPTDLLTTDNTLVLQFEGRCQACTGVRAGWVTIDAHSQIDFAGTKLALPNDLALLPIPFFDPAGQGPWSLPVVFGDTPDPNTLEAASAVCSWFGVFSDFRGVQFPISIGELPEGSAVVFALRRSRLASSLPLSSRAGGVIAIRDNPRDPYGKLLIISGDRTDELLAAARTLVTRNNYQSHSDSLLVGSVHLPVHAEYDAPRWLATDKAATIGTYTTAEHLRLMGSGSINIYFRLPPDLFLPAQQLIPLRLNYEYSGVAQHADAGLHVRLNGDDIDTIRLRPAPSAVQESEIVRIPTGRLQPYSNTLTIDFYFGAENPPPSSRRYAAIRRDSSLDLTGLPHSVLLPRLELFGDAGYPFTRWPDLSHTAVLLPDAASASDYEALLDMAGFFGAQTGSPATGITVTDASRVEMVQDKDLVLLGTPGKQPLFSEWQSDMPVGLSTDGMHVNRSPAPSRILYPELPFRDRDWDRLTQLVAQGKQPDLVVEDFVSPLNAERSVVAVVSPSSSAGVAALFMPATRQGPVYGGVAVLESGYFQSFLVGSRTYRSGHLDRYQYAIVFAFENYRLIPLLVMLLALVVGAWLRRSTEAVAARRLAAGGI
jgi:cellulose synthase (UDP-forming)